MIMKLALLDFDIHRNETTFRPYVFRQQEFTDHKIHLIDSKKDADYYLVGQASIIDKKKSLEQSVEEGIKYCDKLDKQFIIIDGQDSHSLIGVYEVFKDQFNKGKCIGLLKNTLLRDLGWYKNPYINGRMYWGEGNYSIPDIEDYTDHIKLSQSNWLSTTQHQFIYMDHVDKEFDVFGMFQYPCKADSEHGLQHSDHYDAHRKPCFDTLIKLSEYLSVATLRDGKKVHHQTYYDTMMKSKVVVAPFGFGEIAPRDLEAMIFKAILIKPTMKHLKSEPFIYDDGRTYIACRWDFKDLEEKIKYAVEHYDELIESFYHHAKMKHHHQYLDAQRLPFGFSQILKELIE